MASTARLCLLLPLRPSTASSWTTTAAIRCSLPSYAATRSIHRPSAQPAKVVPIYGTGPPPEPPTPSVEFVDAASRLARRKRQGEMLRQAKDERAAAKQRHSTDGPGARESALAGDKKKRLAKRFWKAVHVKEINGAYEIHLDERALRRPNTKDPIRLPLSKPHLASALALEWDQLVSALEGTKQHLIPLTSLVCRALDIADDDALHPSPSPSTLPTALRAGLAATLLRYLDTDSLLCWAPPVDEDDLTSHASILNADGHSLRELQEAATRPIVSFLTSRVWPGVSLVPVLDGTSIMPRQQEPGTREVVQGWVLGLSSWELAALERATLGGKSLLVAARLVTEWSEGLAGVVPVGEKHDFGVEQAALAASVEVDWQTGRWGEVEDTHDVEREDVKRQFGSVVLLVSGTSGVKAKL
ncbi:hypothetical protein B0T25DRAFT_492173 [Lasiosphaeria hispida]|uniref:ATP12-domain-containing protein n=1 Tax=Lasiosphaeria hispida TaxID=260671 RepID=A0AAJ0MK45_9PEZI|nr:hypothetical protein B0T25DRAFT_492173 [Lasiosphaeria hispida]